LPAGSKLLARLTRGQIGSLFQTNGLAGLGHNALMTPPEPLSLEDFSSLFTFLPIGAYRSSPEGRMLRSNSALVRLNGYDTEVDHLASVKDIQAPAATRWLCAEF
jgi:hypothetical protein